MPTCSDCTPEATSDSVSHDAAQAWVGGEDPDKRLRAHQPGRGFFDVRQGLKHEAVALEEFTAVGLRHGAKQIPILRKALREFIGRSFGEFRRRCPHDRQGAVLGKCLVEGKLTMVPGQVPAQSALRHPY